MKKINYKSDFDLIVRLKDCEGTEVPWPECDWDATFWTSGMASYAASYNSATGEYKNCFREADGSMHFVFDSHGLGIGELKWQPHFALENTIYEDGYQNIYTKAELGLELVVVGEDCPLEVMSLSAGIPVIAGGSDVDFDNLTREQKDAIRIVCAGSYDMSDDFNGDFSN